jgi:uncharacterized membrane protein YfcA
MLTELALPELLLAIVCGVLIGMSKAGLSGFGLLVVPVFAAIFGGKPSTGLLLPMLITADVFAVVYYSRHADWRYILKLMPWAVAGILLALWTGSRISDVQFRQVLAVVVLVGIGLLVFQDVRRKRMSGKADPAAWVPHSWWFSALLGLAGGFATMIGNAAGPVMSLYLLSMRLPKNVYIGTSAWFFFIINLIKVPLHVVFWKTINLETLEFNLYMIVPVLAGAVGGIWLVKHIPEKWYRFFIIASTVAAAGVLFR